PCRPLGRPRRGGTHGCRRCQRRVHRRGDRIPGRGRATGVAGGCERSHEGSMNPESLSYHDVIRRNASLHGERIAFIDGDERRTHAEHAKCVARLAGGLARIGVGAGDRIAVLLSNGMTFVELLGAAASLGAMVVPVNARLSVEEVEHVLRDTSPKVVVVEPGLASLLPASLPPGCTGYTTGEADATRASMRALY